MSVFYFSIIKILFFAESDLNDIAGLTMQNLAEFMQGFHGDILVMSDIAHSVAADIVVVDQAVSCNAAIFHSAPQDIIIVHDLPLIVLVSIITLYSHNEHIAEREHIAELPQGGMIYLKKI